MRMFMQKQKVKNSVVSRFGVFPILLVVSVLAFTGLGIQRVLADQFDAQIKVLQQDSAAKRGAVSQLGAEAASLTDVISKLQAQINATQNLINGYKAKQADLEKQIADAEAKLAQQKEVLGANIQQVYYEGDISTLEVLASSHDLSEFVDKQEYRNFINDQIKSTLDQITALKHQLSDQKQQVEALLKDQESAQAQLTDQQNQQSAYLNANVDQQNALNSQIKQNSQTVSALRAQQAAANARLFNGANLVLGSACDTAHGDTYPSPWCSSAQDSMVDYWGMYNRECVSYTAWKVSESGRHMPYWGGVGNANQWDDDARAAGIPVDSSPRAGDVAIKNSLPYGHAMYVESVNPNGTINISQYNASLDGRYSLAYNVSAGGLVFIHF
ncbi:MAG TPA: CHAP domain-containing protein [Candidatus Saccharimonadales bacterium]|nr:CHAP domain-containing protein [Candidatus Saccharimonadales bacterium]